VARHGALSCLRRALADHDLGRDEGLAPPGVRALGIRNTRPVRKQAVSSATSDMRRPSGMPAMFRNDPLLAKRSTSQSQFQSVLPFSIYNIRFLSILFYLCE
jgi:hypothetical protein